MKYYLTTKRNDYTLRLNDGTLIKEWKGLPLMQDIAEYIYYNGYGLHVLIPDEVWGKAIMQHIKSLT